MIAAFDRSMLWYLACLAMGTALCAYCIKLAAESEAQVKRDMLLREAVRMFRRMGQHDALIQRVESLEKQVEAMHAQLQAQAQVGEEVCHEVCNEEGVFEFLGTALGTAQKLD